MEEWVKYYSLYRPSYAVEAIDTIIRISKISGTGRIADIGSGTGILSKQFLDLGYRVTGIEPNSIMKSTGDKLLSQYKEFIHLPGTAEDTTLETNTIDLLVVGSAFHWFDRTMAKKEFVRIVKPPHWCAILQNRQINESPFMSAYDETVKKYREKTSEELFGHVRVRDAEYANFFNQFQTLEYENNFSIGYTELKGKLNSVSYLPEIESNAYKLLIEELSSLFHQFAVNGKILFTYTTKLIIGQL